MIKTHSHLKQVLILVGLSYIFFMAGNGILSLTNPDEVFYVQTAKEMVGHHSWMTPYLFGAPQFEKPILTYWLLRIGFIVFGISSFSARFFPALFAGLGVLAIYFLGLMGFKNEKKAIVSAIILCSASFYVGMARTVFTDMIFSVFILLSLVSFFWGYTDLAKKRAGIMLFFVFAGLAVLTKGPLGILIPFLAILLFLIINKNVKFFICRDLLWGSLIFCLICLPWYILMIRKYQTTFTHEFFYNDHFRRIIEAEHRSNDTWYFYPLSMIGSMFPWSLYLVISFIYFIRRLRQGASQLDIFLACWIVSVTLIFQSAHSKLVSYILPLFPALAVIAGDYIYEALGRQKDKFFFLVSLLTWIFLFSIPIGLMVASRKFSVYLSSPVPVFIFASILIAYLIWMVLFIYKRKFRIFIYFLMFQIPLMLGFAFWVHEDFESYVSSKNASEYLLKNYKVENTILCAKFFSRGVWFYTDKDVAVMDINGKNFFSPHPIPFLDTSEKVRDFLRRQGTTYGVFKKSYAHGISEITGPEFNSEILKTLGDEYLIRIAKR